MTNPQIHSVSDVCTEMKELARLTSQHPAKGSFATQDMLADFCQAFIVLCEEISHLREEIAALKAAKSSTASQKTVRKPKPR